MHVLAHLASASVPFVTVVAVPAHAAAASSSVAVTPQYDTTYVYVALEDFDGFVASLVPTFGGTTTK
jgi:hypothetical protein